MKFILSFSYFFLCFTIYSDVAPANFTLTLTKPIAKASSIHKEKKRSYPPEHAIDSKLETAWCEGVKGPGIGETLELQFQPTGATQITLLNGYGENRNLYESNNRIKDYEATITTRNGRTFKQKGQFSDNRCIPGDERECIHLLNGNSKKEFESCLEEQNKQCIETKESLGNEIIFNEPLCVTKFEIKILSVYKGKKFDDTCIAEVKLVQPDPRFFGEDNQDVQKLKKICK